MFSYSYKINLLPKIRRHGRKRQEYLGHGSTRIVYDWSKHRAIKIVMNDALWQEGVMSGVEQTKKEVKIYNDFKCRPALTKVYYYGADYKWIVVEKVKTFKTAAEFKRTVGMSVQHMTDAVYDNKFYKKPNCNVNINALSYTYYKHSLGYSELEDFEHWGITKNNRLVLVDFGY